MGSDSIVVIDDNNENMSDRADLTGVAWTLKYVNIQNIAILDGSYKKWAAEEKTVSTDMVKPKVKLYQVKANNGLFAKKNYVMQKSGKLSSST